MSSYHRLRQTLAGALTGLLALTGTVLADNASDSVPANTVRVGGYAVFYHSSATDIYGPYVPEGVNLDVKNVQTLYLAYVRRLSEKLNLEFAFGYPPKTETVGKGPATLGSVPYAGQTISSARWVAPSLLINYEFLTDKDPIRPYIGIGVNYTQFIDRESTAAGNAANGGPTAISLSSSVGPVGTVGVYGRINNHWNAIASYSLTHIKSHLVANTAGTLRTSDISFGPGALVVALGYSF